MAAIIVGDEVTIVGNIISNGKVQVEGNVQGHVFCTNIRICDGGRVTGGIVAETVTVHGQVSGPINALSVSLESGSHVEADICHREFRIDHDCYFEGRSHNSENPLMQALSDIEQFRNAAPDAPEPKPPLPQLQQVQAQYNPHLANAANGQTDQGPTADEPARPHPKAQAEQQ
ncbi:MAG: polymer-forming cytoskeletal protein [Hyphomicrobiaceae bacterium]|nr:polymer-forming cytoskeletal protein [Hyphomicrobiaceae bacterium]